MYINSYEHANHTLQAVITNLQRGRVKIMLQIITHWESKLGCNYDNVMPVAFQPKVGIFFLLVIRLNDLKETSYLKRKVISKKKILLDKIICYRWVGGMHLYVT